MDRRDFLGTSMSAIGAGIFMLLGVSSESTEFLQLGNQELNFFGSKIPFPLQIGEFSTQAGKPSRTFHGGGNDVHTWDDRGWLAYCDPGTTEIHCLNILLRQGRIPYPDSYAPKNFYPGSVQIPGFTLFRDCSLKEILRQGFSSNQLRGYYTKAITDSLGFGVSYNSDAGELTSVEITRTAVNRYQPRDIT